MASAEPLDTGRDYPLLQAAILLTLAVSPPYAGQPPESRGLLVDAWQLCQRVDRPPRWAADIARALGEPTGEGQLLAVANDMDRKLGIRRPQRPLAGFGQILADRPGERAPLTRPGFMPADLTELQFWLVEGWLRIADALGEVLREDMPDIHLDWPAQDLRALRLGSGDVATQALPWELAGTPSGAGRVFPLPSGRWHIGACRSQRNASKRTAVPGDPTPERSAAAQASTAACRRRRTTPARVSAVSISIACFSNRTSSESWSQKTTTGRTTRTDLWETVCP